MSHGSARVLPKNILAFVASPQVPLVEEEEYVTVLEDTFVAANENYMRSCSCSCSWASTASGEIVLMIVIFCSMLLLHATGASWEFDCIKTSYVFVFSPSPSNLFL